MSEEYNPYHHPNGQTQYQYQQPYQQPVYQQPVYPAPQPVQGSSTPCVVSLVTGIASSVLTTIGLSCVMTMWVFAVLGLMILGGLQSESAEDSIFALGASLWVTALVMLIAAIAAVIVSMIFGIKGISEKRRFRPMAIIGVVFSGLSIAGILASVIFCIFIFI